MASKTPASGRRDAAAARAVDLCACLSLRKAARAVTQLYDQSLEPSGLRATQFTVLAAVSLWQPAPLGRLAEALVMDRTTLSRNLRPLETRGLIRSERGRDGRSRFLRLTAAGQRAVRRALPLWEKAEEQVAEGLGKRRLKALLKELGLAVAVAQAALPAGKAPP